MKRLIATLVLATVAFAAAACSSTNAGGGTPDPSAGPADPNAPVIVADALRFTAAEVTVPAGKPFQLTFENREGPPHNVAIYTDASASQVVYQGEIFSGPATKVYDVPALDAGSYFFRCDVHPDMKGTLVAN